MMAWTCVSLVILLFAFTPWNCLAGASVCSLHQHACKDKCIPISWLCNGERDCPDGTDEQCDLACHGDPNAWQCDDGKCISISWKCDGVSDCMDGSDEVDCACAGKKIQCTNNECINEWEVCDGHNDCEDGSDEKNCPKISCAENQWLCQNNVCVMESWRCNGIDNCGDGTDEDQCVSCDGVTMCSNGKCINGTQMCNRVVDCPDGSDETLSCGRQCSDGNGGCMQHCEDVVWGSKCSCYEGWKLEQDGQSCIDIDECSVEYSPCHQVCNNTIGSYSCGCIEGFELKGKNSCEVIDNATQILLASDGEISIIDARTGDHQRLLSVKGMPIVVAYDLYRESYYWIDEKKTLHKYVVGGKNSTSIYPDVRNVNSLSVEWFTGQLYWASRNSKSISVGLADGRGYMNILEKDIAPDQLIVLPSNRYMYWVNFGNKSNTTIETAGMDGSDRHVIAFVPMEQPIGLMLDFVTLRLYWISEYKESIETVHVNGSGRFTFPNVLQKIHAPVGLSVFERWFFLADENMLISLSRDNLMEREMLFNTSLISAFTVLHELQQPPNNQSPCSQKTCSHICLLSPVLPKSYKCTCPEGMFLLPSGKCENFTIMCSTTNEINLLEFGFKGTFEKRTLKQQFDVNVKLLTVDWKRDLTYWIDDQGQLTRAIGSGLQVIQTGGPVCLAKIDIPTGNIYWLSCEKNTVFVTKYSGIGTKTIYKSNNSINNVLVNWEKSFLYVVEDEKIIRRMSLIGSDIQDVFQSTDFAQMSLDLKLYSIVWRSQASGLYSFGLLKGKLLHLMDNFTSILMDAYGPYIVSYNEPLIEIWDKKAMKIITTLRQENVTNLQILTSSYLKGSQSVCSLDNGGCSSEEICVASPGQVIKCLCPDDKGNCSNDGESSVEDFSFPITPFCPRTFVPCKDGKECISSEFVCDGEKDCLDGSDEENCALYCSKPGIFQCQDGKKCIQERYRCDGIPHCPDASDEQGCWKPTETCAMLCDRSTRCVPRSWVCDGNPDCFDEADEQGCERKECSSGKFQCDNGQCIPYTMRCDGDNDCDDHSDELNCTIPRPLQCRDGEFKCHQSGECILRDWHCDGSKDCKDGTDEEGCVFKKITCGNMQWQCASEDQCVPTFWRCDGSKDCRDGSDESTCGYKPCPNNTFQCKTLDCVPTAVVCNGKNDCLDGSDEGGKCNITCERECSHSCYVSPDGPECLCEKGFKLEDDECIDINECKEYKPCSQSCMNQNGTYSCACHPGYMLEPDGHQCKVTGSEPVLLIAIQYELLLYKLRTSEEEILASTDKNLMIISVDYDVMEQRIFWMDLNAESIKWVTMGTKAKGTLVKGIKSDCIAVDWAGRNLYWTDGSAGEILATSLNSTWKGYPEYAVVIDDYLEQPHSLVLHPLNGLMYWSEIGRHPQIEQAGMDGTYRKVLITEQLGWPTGLALDLLSWKIYWSDDKLHCIGSASLHGTDIKIIQLKNIQSPFSLTVFEDSIYWSEIKARTVQKIDKNTGKKWEVLLKRHGQPYGLKVMHEVLQPRMENPCQKKKCSHLCFIGPDLKGSCRCPRALLLSSDMRRCVPFKDSPFLLIALPTSVTQVYLQKLTYASHEALTKTKLVTLSNVNQISSIDYVVQDRSLIFAVENGGYIAAAKVKENISNDWKKILAVEDNVVSVAVDWITGNIFWISTSKPHIKVASSNGLYKTILVIDGISRLSCLAIHPPTSVMCYSDVGSDGLKYSPKIECSHMDGTKRKAIWKKNRVAVGLTFADSGTRLYWADRVLGTIESIKLDGSKYKLIRNELHNLNLFTTGEGVLLWTVSSNGSMVWFSKIEAREQGFIEMGQAVADIRMYSSLAKQGSNGCSDNNGGCSQICLPYPEGRTCKCTSGHRLVNGTVCLEEMKCPKGTQPCKDGFKCIAISKVCDRNTDCLDGSDEKSCTFLDNNTRTKSVTTPQKTTGFRESNRDLAIVKTKAPNFEISSPADTDDLELDLPTDGFGRKMESRPCNAETCNMRGTCVVENDEVKCQCMIGYSGNFCETGLKPLAVPLTLGTVGVLLIFVVAAGVFVYITKRKALQRTFSSASSRTLTPSAEKDIEHIEPEYLASSETFLNEAFDSEGFTTEQELIMALKTH